MATPTNTPDDQTQNNQTTDNPPVDEHPAVEPEPGSNTDPDPDPKDDEPFYVATGKELKTADDAIDYIKELEQKQLNTNQPPINQPANNTEHKQTRAEYLADLQFSDPVKYQEEIQKDFDNKVEMREQQKQQLNAFYNKFYGDYPDLKGNEYLVKLVQSDKMNELKDLSPAQASKELAKHCRAALKSNGTGEVTKVETKDNTVLEPGVQTTVTKKTTEQPKSFNDQLLEMQKKKGLG